MRIKLSDYLSNRLVEKGIRHVFTVSGGGAMHLNDSLGNNPGLISIYNHNEQACAVAAEGYYRASDKMPAVCVTTGPGGTNALTGVLGAWLDSIPMLVISGQVKFECTIRSTDIPLRQLGDQEYNIIDSARPMTKYACMVTEPNKIRYHLDKALYIATHGRPGPVWLDVPLNVQAAVIDTEDLIPYDPEEDAALQPPAVSEDTIDEVIRKLKESKMPAIIAGTGIKLSGGREIFDRTVHQLNIPVMTAWGNHDLMDDSDPLNAGRPGTVGTRGGNFVFQTCDLLLVLGCRMNLRQIGYVWDKIAPNAYKIMVDIDTAELKKATFKPDLPIHADVKEFMEKLAETGFSKQGAQHERWLDWCQNINRKYSYDGFKSGEPETINPYAFIRKLFSKLPENQQIVTSNGSACVVTFQAAEIKKGQRMFTNSGCASMGYGLPAALGACVGIGKKSTICLEGDGSIMMNIQELQTVIHNRLPLKIFILNNRGYHSIRQTQCNFFKERYVGVDQGSGVSFPDTEKLANAYGYDFYRITNEEGADSVIESILKNDRPLICEVHLSIDQNFEPKSSSKILPDGKMVSMPLEDMYPFLSDEEMEQNKF
jgi:acetolactate synthase-1/2/3 large subunit